MTAVIHYGSNGSAECGADNPTLTMASCDVTCQTCRGYLPIVAPDWKDAYPPMTAAREGR